MALERLKSPDKETRHLAHQTLWQLGDNIAEDHRLLLQEAKAHHFKQFKKKAEDADRSLRPFAAAYGAWTENRDETLSLAREDLKDDSSAFAKLERLLTQTKRRHRALEKEVTAAADIYAQLTPLVKILQEFELEAGMLEDIDDVSPGRMRDWLEKCLEGKNLIDWYEAQRRLGEDHEQFEGASMYNKRIASWPQAAQRDFARIIGETREALGLEPLYLQEELSQAAKAHSAEMKKLDYFSHTSPVPANKTPEKRASNAGYPGSFLGENIAAGFGSAASAFQGWWHSDGHRKIMLMKGANHLGVGVVSTHWTMLMGKGEAPSMESTAPKS